METFLDGLKVWEEKKLIGDSFMPVQFDNPFGFLPPVASALPALEIVPMPETIFISIVATAWFSWQVFQTGDLHARELGRGRRLRDKQFQQWMQWYELMGHSRLDAIRFAHAQTNSPSPSSLSRFSGQAQQVALPNSGPPPLPGFAKTENEVLTVLERYPWLFRLSDAQLDEDADAAGIACRTLIYRYIEKVKEQEPNFHDLGAAWTSEPLTNIRLMAQRIRQHYFGFSDFDANDRTLNPNGASPASVFIWKFTLEEEEDMIETLRQHNIDSYNSTAAHRYPYIYLLARTLYPERYGWSRIAAQPTQVSKPTRVVPLPRSIFFQMSAAPVHPVRYPTDLSENLNFFPEGTGDGENWTALNYPITVRQLEDPKLWGEVQTDIGNVATHQPIVVELEDVGQNRIDLILSTLLRNGTFHGDRVRFLLYRSVEMGINSAGETRRGRTLEDVLDFTLDRSGETPKVSAVKSFVSAKTATE